MAQTTAWVFTLNNPEADDAPTTWVGVKDAIWQREQGEAGTPHLQGFVRFDSKKRLAGVKKIEPRAHWEAAKDIGASIAYCSKEDTRVDGPWTIGTPAGVQGKRNDFAHALTMIRDGETVTDVAEAMPGMMRYLNQLERYKELHTDREAKRRRRDEKVGAALRPWQQELSDMLDLPADGRHFCYIFETTGNVGKSWMASYLQATRGAFWTRPGKIADLAHAYQREGVVVIDIVRTNVEGAVANVYGFTESLLDGSIFSPKYGSTVKTFDPPHVIIFSNDAPDYTKMSRDRYVVYEIVNNTLVTYNEPPNMTGVNPCQIFK